MPRTATRAKQNGTVPHIAIPGAVLAGLWKRIECPFPVIDGSPPLWAEIRIDFDFDTHDRMLGLGATPSYGDLFPLVAPFVRAWNATAIDETTGERVPVPPPTEAGTDALRTQSPVVTAWLFAELKMAPFGGMDGPKEPSVSTASASTPES